MENSINYNKAALQEFNLLLEQINFINQDLKNLQKVATTCSQQNMTAIVTLTVLDNEKYEALNARAEKELFMKRFNSDGQSDVFMFQPGATGQQLPPIPSKEQREREEMMMRNRQNASMSIFQVNTENYPSVSLKIIAMLKEGLVEQRNQLQKRADAIAVQVFTSQQPAQ